ncbi:MAG: DUF58 domain-containing protein [Acidobacteria bacterium]|nr:DUF58 domain-containing protein [Acidobacteriota bacterium]
MSVTRPFPGFKLRLTRFGAIFLAGMLVGGLAAANTGNNALVMMLGIAMGSFVVSGTWSRQVLGRVEVCLELPRRLHAGTPAPVEVIITNRSRLFPAYGLVIRDEDGAEILVEPLVGTRSVIHRTARIVPPRRGWETFGPWRLEVVLPLGFFVKSKLVGTASRRLVYPRLARPGSVALANAVTGPRWSGSGRRGRDGELRELRDFREGDERRQIHWKQSARQQRLIVVDRDAPSGEPLFVVVDPRAAGSDGTVIRERFESVLSAAATVVVERLRRGLPVGVVVGRIVIQPSGRLTDVERLLRPLAEARMQPPSAPPPAMPPGLATLRLGIGEAAA